MESEWQSVPNIGGTCPASTGHKRAVKRKHIYRFWAPRGSCCNANKKHISHVRPSAGLIFRTLNVYSSAARSIKTRHEGFCEARGAARRSKASRPCPPLSNALNNSVFQMHLLEGSILNQRNLIKREKIQSL